MKKHRVKPVGLTIFFFSLLLIQLSLIYLPGQASSEFSPKNNSHIVFVEDGTASWCSYCPFVAQRLHELYENQGSDTDFYYVNMIYDRNDLAYTRLVDDYNMYGFPTVYIDGGYELLVGEQETVAFEDAIENASERQTPDISVDLSLSYNDATEEIETTVTLENNESEVYEGTLRVYLTEIISRWADLDGKAYHFGFLDYIIDTDIIVPGQDVLVESDIYNALGLDPENLKVFAVVFNAESHQGYSNPPDGNPFDAHYADNVVARDVIEDGNLPPGVGIAIPRYLRYHLFGNVIWTTPLYKHTYLFGRTTMKFVAQDDSSIDRVDITLTGKLREYTTTLTEEPYEWVFHHLSFGKYHLTATAYDDSGKQQTAEMDVFIFML